MNIPTTLDYCFSNGIAKTSLDSKTYTRTTSDDLADYLEDSKGYDFGDDLDVTTVYAEAGDDNGYITTTTFDEVVEDMTEADWYGYCLWLERREVAAEALRQSAARDMQPASQRSLPTILQPVESSMMSHMGYLRAAYTLFVQFHDGSLYAYFGVQPEQWAALRATKSKGQYMRLYIFDIHAASRVSDGFPVAA
ncbi:hypothetical protein LEM8419_03522 [Neolewinella maritima]|uniref:KTSC domain-containing protein n=1 Tax=Neolewinella maritima TaxID=1383882 RepID=A0ABM9B5H5_9BACT|nr:KTSC domain-containing protein [Neolewinella maritima]CAH1002650.1 hypothetical protein LEM8419_03522 [Neolewinella maritima]